METQNSERNYDVVCPMKRRHYEIFVQNPNNVFCGSSQKLLKVSKLSYRN